MPTVSHRKNHAKKLRMRRQFLSSPKGRSHVYDEVAKLRNIYLNIFFPEKMEELRKFQEEMIQKYQDMMTEKEQQQNKSENVSE